MRRGETFAVPPVSGATLDTGNAAGLEITVDGRPAASLGGQGIVRRGFALDTLTGPAARDAASR